MAIATCKTCGDAYETSTDAPGHEGECRRCEVPRLRARVAGLETSAARLRADLDLTQGAVAEEVKARVATEQRAATLQAEVERLTDALSAEHFLRLDAERDLTESERKRAELVKRLSDAHNLARDLQPCGHDGDEEDGQHDEDCEACTWEQLMGALEAE